MLVERHPGIFLHMNLHIKDLPRLRISQVPRTGKPYKLDKLPPEISYSVNGQEYKVKVIYVRAGIAESHRFLCDCGKAGNVMYFHDRPRCNKCVKEIASTSKKPDTLDDLYRKLQEYIDHNRTMEFIGRKKFNKRIKDLSSKIARLEAELNSKL